MVQSSVVWNMDSTVSDLAHRARSSIASNSVGFPRNDHRWSHISILGSTSNNASCVFDDLFTSRFANRYSKRKHNTGDLSAMTTSSASSPTLERESETPVTSERRQILEMLAAGKISADEAERLLQLTSTGSVGKAASSSATSVVAQILDPKFIRIMVEPSPDATGNHARHHVNVRVPLKIIRAGVNMASLIPNDAGHMVQDSLLNKGYKGDLSKLDATALDELIEALQELSIDATVDNHLVKVFVE